MAKDPTQVLLSGLCHEGREGDHAVGKPVNHQEEIRIPVCKKCHQAIGDTGLCSDYCFYDTCVATRRPEDMVECKVFKFVGFEPYKRPVGAAKA